ncbi:hypothetical protein I0C86_31985 [Plantactinospora sp. S1510]|uniref:Uncharacterized protein n=1 Tax=Plantactinospora alkalitolerans TaxID=2789879 RepID=A0ABS0H4Y2_9ACTN|nr:hypothetical protein [Plantactinospora alkalitolerans]MBF9133522.1 hypothetical protein [Plantactinospora alkalitolerans]
MRLSDAPSADTATLPIEQAAREATRRLAPAELALFDDITVAWRHGRLAYQGRPHRPVGGTVGFGLDFTLIGELAYAVICTAVGEVLGPLANDRVRRRTWWRRRARPEAAEPSVGRREVTLRQSDVELLWAACRRHGVALGLSEGQAELLADAVRDAIRRPRDPS